MFGAIGGGVPPISSADDKRSWAAAMDGLLDLRANALIGDVLDHLLKVGKPHLPEAVERAELQFRQSRTGEDAPADPGIERTGHIRQIAYQEVIALAKFIDDKTPFSTKHGVKGAEFENVLVVLGRGWNLYDFNQFLEWAGSPAGISDDERDAFERNRNLFYVACSRPKKRLALLFTQQLSESAIDTLSSWFGPESVHSLRL